MLGVVLNAFTIRLTIIAVAVKEGGRLYFFLGVAELV